MNQIVQMFRDSNERMKKIMAGKYVPDDMDRAQREAEIMVKNCNIVMGFYQTAAKNARTMRGLDKMNLMDDTTAIDLMLGDPETDKVKCPEHDNLITRSECLDYSGDHHDDCDGCEIGKATKSKLLQAE